MLKLEFLAWKTFLKVYHYRFRKYPLPPCLSKPCEPLNYSEFISCPVDCPQLIEAHINIRGLKSKAIPRAYAKKIVSDLYENVKKCLNSSPGQGWKTESYHNVYSESIGLLPNCAIDFVWIWQVVTAVDWNRPKPMQRNFLLLYYVGVIYMTKEMPPLYQTDQISKTPQA